MKFTVSQSALARAIGIVSKGLASNSTLPILSGILLRASEGTLELQTSNLTISIRHELAANVEAPGETVVSGRMLSSIAKSLPDAAVTFEGEGSTLDISCGRAHFRLATLDPQDFPEFPPIELQRSIELPAAVLEDMVGKVYRFVSKEASPPVLTGISMTVEGSTLRLVATDSIRLAVCEAAIEAPAGAEGFSMIVPGASFHDVISLPSNSGTITVGSTENQVVFVYGTTTYVSRRIEGNYPDAAALLPDSASCRVTFDVAEMSAALRRVAVVAVNNPAVRFDFDADAAAATLSSVSTDQGEASESVSAAVEGASMTIGLNNRLLLEGLQACPEDTMTLDLQDPTRPAVFRSLDGTSYLYLLMPVRI